MVVPVDTSCTASEDSVDDDKGSSVVSHSCLSARLSQIDGDGGRGDEMKLQDLAAAWPIPFDYG